MALGPWKRGGSPLVPMGGLCFFMFFSFIRVCILLGEARTRQLSENGIRFSPPTDVTVVEGPVGAKTGGSRVGGPELCV